MEGRASDRSEHAACLVDLDVDDQVFEAAAGAAELAAHGSVLDKIVYL